MKKTLAMLLLMALFFSGVLAVAEQKWISDDNKAFFADLLTDLMRAYETPSKDDDTRIDTDLAQIRLVSESDWEIASAIAEHWRDVYLDDDYPLFIYKEGEQLASALKETSLRDSERHAFVLLGYELKNGEMQPELVGRCDAAAAAAALYRKYFDYSVEIVGNYCFDIEPAHDVYRYDDRIAINQIAHLLGVPLEMSM